MSSGRTAALLFAALSSILVVTLTPEAASQTADLSGTVTDSSGAVVVSANVTITSRNSGVTRATSSRDQGLYRFSFLLPGSYAVTAVAPGFQAADHPDFKLDPSQRARLDFVLKPAKRHEEITVRARESSLQTESPAVATEVDAQLIRDLPMNNRSFQTLIALAPGVVGTGMTQMAPQGVFAPGGISVNGQRDTSNYFTLDGVSANVAAGSGAFGQGPIAAGTVPPVDVMGGTHGIISTEAMQEFKLQTSTYPAEYGRADGGQLEIVSRSGSNQYHGSAFDYLRNDALDANDWLANAAGFHRVPLRQNDFGGVFGGPIRKNRIFFFFSYEGLRSLQSGGGEFSVPDLLARRQATGPVRQLLDAFPLPNGPDDPGSLLATLFTTGSGEAVLDSTSIRFDQVVNDRLTVFGRYSEAPSKSGDVGGWSEFDRGEVNTRSATVGATITHSPQIASDLRLNYFRTEAGGSARVASWGGAIPPADSVLFPAPFASPETSLTFVLIDSFTHFREGRLADNLQRQGNLVSNTSLLRGRHDVRFGADYRYLTPHYGPFNYRSAIFFAGVVGALSGIANEVDVSAFDSVTMGLHNLSLYGQDNWKISPRLTLTYGLRWELVPPPHAKGNQPLLTVTGFPDLEQLQVAPPGTPLYNTSYTNFAPRLGAAYQLFRAPGTQSVIRGGFGVFYDLGLGDLMDAAASFPHLRESAAFGVPYPLSSQVAAPPPPPVLEPPYSGTFNVLVPDHALPRNYQWNVTFDQSFGSNQMLSTSYVGELGRKLLRQNVIMGSPNPRFDNSEIFITANSSSADYQALELQFRRRMSHGLAALFSYTWSHSIDDTSTDIGFDNLVNPRFERGPSDFDVRHSLKLAFTYAIPAPIHNTALRTILRNWLIASIYGAQTALPVNVVIQRFDTGTDPTLNQTRPDLISGVPLYMQNPTLPGGRGINPAAFTVPIEVRQGDLARNALRGFAYSDWDFALQRQFGIGERLKLELRADFFNVLNTPHFALDGGLGLFPPFQPNPTFGIGNRTVGGPRQIQLALRLGF
jgi:hypothetical protein